MAKPKSTKRAKTTARTDPELLRESGVFISTPRTGDAWGRTVSLRTAVTDEEVELSSKLAVLRQQLEDRVAQTERAAKDSVADLTSRLRHTLEELRRKEKVAEILGRVHPDAAPALIHSDDLQASFGDAVPRATYVMSIDIRRSTDLMLRARTPQLYASFISGLIPKLMDTVVMNHGIFDKFTGDGILAFFPEFFTGKDAGLRVVNAALACHELFATYYDENRASFQVIAKNVGLGIGVDYGDVHFLRVLGALTVVGAPVVYACRLGGASAGMTLLNHAAFEAITNNHKGHCELAETELNVKHEGAVVAYAVTALNREHKFGPPGWASFVNSPA